MTDETAGTLPVPFALHGLLSDNPLPGRCQAAVYDRALKMSFQCSRKDGDQVGGIAFCTQHAAVARRLLAQDIRNDHDDPE